MSAKKRPSLGRGLGELLSNSTFSAESKVAVAEQEGEMLQQLSLDQIHAGKYQPRRDMNVAALEELASSIKEQGILQPIVVRPLSNKRYEIIAGERRWRAAQIAELDKIPVIVRNFSDQQTMAVALIENMQREDLNPMEEAIAIQRLIDECALTHQQVAESLGKSRSSVSNLLRLMSLHSDVKTLLEQGKLELGHAKVLLALNGGQQLKAANVVVAQRLSVRETETLVERMQSPANQLQVPKAMDPDVLRLQNDLSDKLSAAVKIQHTGSGRGKLLISYNNLDELEGILQHIQ